jgi:hypothetical protein
VNENLINVPIQDFVAKNEALSDFYCQANKDGLDKPSLAHLVNNIIDVQPVSITIFSQAAQQCSANFCDFHRRLVSTIQQEYLNNSIGLDVLSSLDFQFQSQLAGEIIDAIQPYSYQFDNIAQTGKDLLAGRARFNQLMNESGWIAFGKGVLEGATLGILSPLTDDDNFTNEYLNGLSRYGQQWDNLAPIIHNSIVQLNAKTYDEAIRFGINKMQPLFDEFNIRNISMRRLLKQLRNGSDK